MEIVGDKDINKYVSIKTDDSTEEQKKFLENASIKVTFKNTVLYGTLKLKKQEQ